MVLRVTVDEIQRDPSKYLRQVATGETFVIMQANKAIAFCLDLGTSCPE